MIRTQKEIANLPKFSRNHCHAVYKVATPVYIDNLHGVGATKLHTEIRVKGFLNRMPFSTFFKLCGTEAAFDSEEVGSITKEIQSGRGVACPQVFIDIESYMKHGAGRCRVVGHEGLDAAAAMSALGVQTLEFQFILLGYTIRHIPHLSSFFNWLSSNMECLDGKPTGLAIQKTLG